MINRTLPLVVIALFLLAAYGCDSARDDGAAAREEEERKEWRAKKANFAAKHNAVVNWLNPNTTRFTLEVQNALIRQDGRPILESVFLEDVRRDAEGMVAQFSSLLPYVGLDCNSRWQLSCTPEQAQDLMKLRSHADSLFIIVRVSSVKRGLIPQSGEDNDGPAGVIVITGQLVDYLKDDVLSIRLTDFGLN